MRANHLHRNPAKIIHAETKPKSTLRKKFKPLGRAGKGDIHGTEHWPSPSQSRTHANRSDENISASVRSAGLRTSKRRPQPRIRHGHSDEMIRHAARPAWKRESGFRSGEVCRNFMEQNFFTKADLSRSSTTGPTPQNGPRNYVSGEQAPPGPDQLYRKSPQHQWAKARNPPRTCFQLKNGHNFSAMPDSRTSPIA